MRNSVTCVVLWLAVLAEQVVRAQANEKPDPTVEVRGIRIVGQGYDKDELRPFNWFSGPSLALLAQVPEGGIIQFDRDASSVTSFTDDKGGDLMSGETKFGKPGFGMSANISKDRKACLVELTGARLPEKGAREMRAAGKMVLLTAKTGRTEAASNIPMKPGSRFTLGGVAFEVTKIGKPDWGDEPLAVTIQSRQDLASIAAVRFIGPDGKAIESKPRGTTKARINASLTVTREFALAVTPETATIEMEFWTDMKRVEVPFDIAVCIGF